MCLFPSLQHHLENKSWCWGDFPSLGKHFPTGSCGISHIASTSPRWAFSAFFLTANDASLNPGLQICCMPSTWMRLPTCSHGFSEHCQQLGACRSVSNAPLHRSASSLFEMLWVLHRWRMLRVHLCIKLGLTHLFFNRSLSRWEQLQSAVLSKTHSSLSLEYAQSLFHEKTSTFFSNVWYFKVTLWLDQDH